MPHSHCGRWQLNSLNNFFGNWRTSTFSHVLHNRELQEHILERFSLKLSQQVGGRIFGEKFAASHQTNCVRLPRLIDVMCGDDDCWPRKLCNFHEVVPNHLTHHRINAGGRLVENEQLGLMNERSGEAHASLLAATQILHEPLINDEEKEAWKLMNWSNLTMKLDWKALVILSTHLSAFGSCNIFKKKSVFSSTSSVLMP